MFNLNKNFLLFISSIFFLISSKVIPDFFFYPIYNDSPEPWAIGFQDGVSPGYTGIIELHNNIFFYLVVIAILVFWMLGSTIYYFNFNKTKITYKYLVHGTLIEILWTIFPAIVLIAIAIPSFRLLYILDEVTLPTITVKVTAHQWYWSYEYSDYETESGDPIEFDSYMVPDSDLEIGQIRLLEVDNPIILPSNTHVRFIVTSTDVLHDFAIPSAGIKIDATPGRLNQSSFFSEREGELFGQCSELCGTYHGFMPIQVEVGSVEDYLSWISTLGFISLICQKKNIQTENLQTHPFILKIRSIATRKMSSRPVFRKTFNLNLLGGAMRTDYKYNNNPYDWLIVCLDVILLLVVISFLILDTYKIIFTLIHRFSELLVLNDIVSINDYIYSLNDNTNNITNTQTTSNIINTTIIHDDGSWSNTIRSMFIYGTGGWRMFLIRSGGTPTSRAFVIASTMGADIAGRILSNSINDPSYVSRFRSTWRTNWFNKDEGIAQVNMTNDTITSNHLKNIAESSNSTSTDTLKKFFSDSNGVDDIGEKFINNILQILKPILEPVQVSYSNEVLANQIQFISIVLFILAIFVMVLIIALLLNILVLLYSDKIISYFKNKYIRGYLNFTKKFIALEVLVSGGFILYFMYNLTVGIRFIATHPLTFD